ncbi:MAG: Prepilin peptidase [Frankiales bacterium]|nr:Prepilin peptidase [Frankiales bacterium]
MAPLLVLVALVGLAIGSFLNVVIWRVPRGESVVAPPSACPSCGNAIRNRDNVPVVGWLLLRGRCRDCGDAISGRYPLVELACGALFVVMALRIGADAALPAYLYLAAVGLALALIDIDVKRLPDVLTLPSYGVMAVLLSVAAFVHHDWAPLIRAVEGGAAVFAVYFALWFIYPSGMGFGDVKLSGVLGGYLGWLSWSAVGVGVFLGFLYGAVFGIGLLLFAGGDRKTKVPFGPFMLAGALTGIFVGSQLVDAYLSLTIG